MLQRGKCALIAQLSEQGGRWFPEQGRQEQAPGAERADSGTQPVSCPTLNPPEEVKVFQPAGNATADQAPGKVLQRPPISQENLTIYM